MELETLVCVLGTGGRPRPPSATVIIPHCQPGLLPLGQHPSLGSWEAGSNPAAFGPLPTAARTCRKMGPGQGLPGCLAGLAGSWAQKGSSSGAALFLLLLAGPLGHYLSHLGAGGCSRMTGMGWGPRRATVACEEGLCVCEYM